MKIRIPLIALFFFLLINAFTQNIAPQPVQQIVLLGNLAAMSVDDNSFDLLNDYVESQSVPTNVLYLGDFLDKNGFENGKDPIEIRKLEKLLAIGEHAEKTYFIPGDYEWNNAKSGGLEKLKNLDDWVKEKAGKDIVLTDDGCAGPKGIELSEDLVMIVINSQWFVQRTNERPEEEDAQCKVFNEVEFWEEVEDEIKDADGKNILLVAHHPVHSYGQYAGYKLLPLHFSPPVIGSFIAAYRQNVGTRKDLSRPQMKAFADRMLSLLSRYPSIITVGGHEFDLQVNEHQGNFHINSGSFARKRAVSQGVNTKYSSAKRGFIQLTYFDNGRIDATAHTLQQKQTLGKTWEATLFQSPCDAEVIGLPNTRYRGCQEVEEQVEVEEKNVDAPITGEEVTYGTTSITAGAQYGIGKFGQTFLGKLYRSTWATEVSGIPILNIDTLFGGLTPHAKGGGGQTQNLKFKAANGQEFAFRSVDKNPTRRKNKELVSGIYGDIVRDLVSSQHPYAPSVVGYLMDELDIPHSNATLYVMPDHPKLGIYREEFAGMLGYLEIKPRGKKKSNKPFKNAEKVESTLGMMQDLIDDHNHQFDATAYAKARVFDMWIADWDRHHDNWKWLVYGDKKARTYRPFPKDRDKALAKLEGFYRVMDWEFVAKDLARFDGDYKGLKSLNNKARNLDRILGVNLTKADWEAAVAELTTAMSDETIRAALERLPTEVRQYSADEIFDLLKKRRKKLLPAIQKYYAMLARYVDLIGSNKQEIFDVLRLENGNVQVQIFKGAGGEKGEKLFDRTFNRGETAEIRLYGLGDDDKFIVRGSTNKSILIRIIEGKGADEIVDESRVRGLQKKTKVYDTENNSEQSLGKESEFIQTQGVIRLQTNKLFNYDYLLILPTFSFNVDDGFGFGLTGNHIRQRFNKPGFGARYTYSINVTTEQNYNLNLGAYFKHVIGRTDFKVGIAATNRDRTFRNFYGFGNEVKIDDALDAADFYENRTASVRATAGFVHLFPHQDDRSRLEISAVYERRDLEPTPDREATSSIYDLLETGQGRGVVDLPGLDFNLDLDFRDNGTFPTKGSQFKFQNFSFYNSAADALGGRFETEGSIFLTLHQIKTPITLSTRVGAIHAYGETPFYYEAFLGQQSNLRGQVRNRFGGDTAAFLNSELRWHLGTIYTPVVPLYVGVFGLYDAGRVWESGEDSDTWHTSIGGGLYIIPYSKSFNLNFTLAKADDESLLFSFRVGFFVR